MKGTPTKYTDVEQAVREHVAARRAQFAFEQKIERQRWEQETLVPEIKKIEAGIAKGKFPQPLELPEKV